MGNFLFREVSSLTARILATDTDFIIQIPAVFVKVTRAKSRKNGEIYIAVPLKSCFVRGTSMLHTVLRRHFHRRRSA